LSHDVLRVAQLLLEGSAAGTGSVLVCSLLSPGAHQFNCLLFHTVGLAYGTFGKPRGKKRDAFAGVFPVSHAQQGNTKLSQLFASASSLIS